MATRYDWPAEYIGDTTRTKTFSFTNLILTPLTPTIKFYRGGTLFHEATIGSGLTKTIDTVTLEPFDLPSTNDEPRFLEWDLSMVDGSGNKRTYLYGTVPLQRDVAL